MELFTKINKFGVESFVIPNSKGSEIKEHHSDETRKRKIARHEAIQWLKRTKTEYSIWWSDWDISGGDTHVHIPVLDRRALFKLQFVTGAIIDCRD
jgi:hypothetical protein